MAAIQVFIGFTTEGTTDARFLHKIVERTFEEIAFECNNDVEPVIQFLDVTKTGLSFAEYTVKASKQGVEELGITILCIHSDADNTTIESVIQNKITPAQQALDAESDENVCKVIVPAIPIQMMESWMLADKNLLKEEIGTTMTDQELGIDRFPESIANPKFTIEEAIRLSRQGMVKRKRKDLKIGDIYYSIGQKVSIEKLLILPSYRHFQEEVRNAYRKLHLLNR